MAKKPKEKIEEVKKEIKKAEERSFRVVYPLRRNGVLHTIGEVVELKLTEDEEARLIGQSLEEITELELP